MDYFIRDVEADDLMQVAEICINGWKMAYRGIIDDEYLDSLDVNQKYERFKSNYKDGHFIVAINDEKVLGFCRYSDEYRDSDEFDCELCALYINLEDRGCGIGSALVNYVMNYFRSIGKETMIIWCLEENYKAREFYEKMGGKLYKQKEIEKGGKKYEEVGFKYELL